MNNNVETDYPDMELIAQVNAELVSIRNRVKKRFDEVQPDADEDIWEWEHEISAYYYSTRL